MGCGACYNGTQNQIPLDENSLLSEVSGQAIKEYAFYVDGEVKF
jgi:hypothetical protein